MDAPQVLSMVDNADDTLGFFEKIARAHQKRRPVFVALEQVETLDFDAVPVLISHLTSFREDGIVFRGDYPRNANAHKRLYASGFFKLLKVAHFMPRPAYSLGNAKAGCMTHAQKNVEQGFTKEVIREASIAVWGKERRSNGTQTALIELMQNTNNHAAPRKGEKHWWLTVDHRPAENRAIFTFVDLGVGVFKSLDGSTKWANWRTFFGLLGGGDSNAENLRLILAGELHRTVTKQEFRGKGLPAINRALNQGWISNLRIITNDVYADVSKQVFQTLKHPFTGTLLSWEMRADNKSLEALP